MSVAENRGPGRPGLALPHSGNTRPNQGSAVATEMNPARCFNAEWNGLGSTLRRLCVAWHLVWVAGLTYILAIDLPQPELWDVWYRNPSVSLPISVVTELVLGSFFALTWWRQRRMSEGLGLLTQALVLQKEGRYEAAEAAYQEGRKLTGLGPERQTDQSWPVSAG